jgi:hypothetical protein
MDDQPRAVDLGRRAGIDRGAAPELFGTELRTQHQLYWFLLFFAWSRSSAR